MITWNYRIVEIKYRTCDESTFEIREVYYDDKGNPSSHTAEASEAFGRTKEELQKDLKAMLNAFKKPALVLQRKRERLVPAK